jgi:NADH-quinone oxidoreductase E subunit
MGKSTTSEQILGKYEIRPESLVPALQEIQEEYGYLSEENLKAVSERFQIPLPQVYSVSTFYNAFSLKPKGKNVIQVCLGTACHVRGANEIVSEIERILGIKKNETTEDGQFSLETVNCLGVCALGPVLMINGNYHGHLTPQKIKEILGKYQ